MLWLIFPIENLRFWSPCMIMKSVHWVRSFIRCNIYNLGNCLARHSTSNQRRTFCSMRNFNDDLAESITCWVLLIESAHLVWLVWGSTLLKIWFLLFYSRLSLHVVFEPFYSYINYILYKRSICVEFGKKKISAKLLIFCKILRYHAMFHNAVAPWYWPLQLNSGYLKFLDRTFRSVTCMAWKVYLLRSMGYWKSKYCSFLFIMKLIRVWIYPILAKFVMICTIRIIAS